MIRFDVRLLVSWLQHIEEFEDVLLSGALYGGAHELTASRSPDELLTIDGRKWLWAQLGPLQEHLEPLALSVGKIEIQYLWNHANKWSGKEMAARLKDFRSKLERELNHRFFLYLTEEEAAQFRSAQPFGPEVASAFPAIVNVELCEASKCLALGRHTACVFHLMRVMEAAVQVFGKKLGATLVKSAAPGKRVSAWGGAIPPQPYGRRTSGGDGNDDAGSCALGVNDRPHVPTVHVDGLPLQAPLMLGRFLASRPARRRGPASGRQWIAGLYSNVFRAERDLAYPDPSVRWCPGANR